MKSLLLLLGIPLLAAGCTNVGTRDVRAPRPAAAAEPLPSPTGPAPVRLEERRRCGPEGLVERVVGSPAGS